MSENEYTTPVVTTLPELRQIEVMLQQKDVTTNSGLRIQSYWVKERDGNPYVVQVLGTDAEVEPGKQYMVLLRERTQTRIADNRTFTELQIAGAQQV